MSFLHLPTELLVKIFDHLSSETLELIESTCVRWSLVIIHNFFKKDIYAQEFSIRRNYCNDYHRNTESSPEEIKQIYQKVHHELPLNWKEGKFTLVSKKLTSDLNPASEGHISSIAAYKDKIYLGKSGSGVDVVSVPSITRSSILNADLDHGPIESRRPCKLCQRGSTLAVLGPNRTKVRLFNTNTDEMVGEIETALGPIYDVAMSDRLLILLSGWTIFYWKIDSLAPERVRGEFQSSIFDIEIEAEFESWLEVHEVVTNKSWVVTRATRMDGGEMRTSSFLNVRGVDSSGHIGPILRPESSRLPDSVYETTSIALSEEDLLALGLRLQEQWVVRVLDLNTGDCVFNTESTHFLSSVQVPLKWEADRLFFKIIPVSDPTLDNSNEYGVSIGFLDMKSRDVVTIPGLVFDNSEDLIHINRSQIYRVNTKLVRIEPARDSPQPDIDLEKLALIHSEDEDFAPIYEVAIHLYDFWNKEA